MSDGKLSFFSKASDLRPKDLEFLYHLDKMFFPMPWPAEAWTSFFLNHEDYLIILYFESEQLSGFSLWQKSTADSFAHLLKIVVEPSRRSKGAGEAMLKASLLELHNKGINNYFLEVEEKNQNAIALYGKMGFKTIHKKSHFYSNGEAALIMTLKV